MNQPAASAISAVVVIAFFGFIFWLNVSGVMLSGLPSRYGFVFLPIAGLLLWARNVARVKGHEFGGFALLIGASCSFFAFATWMVFTLLDAPVN